MPDAVLPKEDTSSHGTEEVKSANRQKTARSAWWRRAIEPIVGLLRRGVSIESISRALALGCATGLSPLIGTTTVTGGVLALVLRLNPVACLTANYAVYPIQIAMVLPFAKLGSKLTGWRNLPISPTELRELIRADGLDALETLGVTLANAALAWLACTPLIFLAALWVSRALLGRWRDQPSEK